MSGAPAEVVDPALLSFSWLAKTDVSPETHFRETLGASLSAICQADRFKGIFKLRERPPEVSSSVYPDFFPTRC